MNIFETLVAPGTVDALYDIAIVVFKVVVVFGLVMVHVAFAPYFERKVIGHMQVRLGPMRVGPHGLLQPIADFIKLFFKEDVIPAGADRPVFMIAPIIATFAAISSLAVIPFFEGFVAADINIGLLFVIAMSSLGSYGIIMAGWASNSKYSFLGGLRSSAQVVSYEIAMGLSLVGPMILAGTLNLTEMVAAQQSNPLGMFLLHNGFPQVIAFFVFLLSAIAETNRPPFDLPEAESELVAGYFVEYSGMRFGLFFVAEYIGMIVISSIGTICFLGGWTLPPVLVSVLPFLGKIPGVFIFAAKVYLSFFVFYWLRATLPRYRYDHLMSLGWKVLIPLTLLNIVLTGLYKVVTS